MKYISLSLVAALFTITAASVQAQETKEKKAPMVVEIRSYNLKPGQRDVFHQLVLNTIPLLKKYKIQVVAHGPSLHDDTSYFLLRAFSSVEERTELEDRFYGSDDWKNGNREAVMASIESYTTVVIPASEQVLNDLKKLIAQQ